MVLYFITSNKNKFAEVHSILEGKVQQLSIDLPEIQERDAKKIIEAKLLEAQQHQEGQFIVEDVSFHMDCLGGFPGPFIKFFIGDLGAKGIYELAAKYGNYGAQAVAHIGYSRGKGDIHFFEGRVEGSIVEPTLGSTFGFDPIFKPKGYDETFAQMSSEEKNKISHRRLAVYQLKEFLDQK